MKIKNFIFAVPMLLVMALVSFTACSDDDDDNSASIDSPATYASDAAKYIISSESSPYKSIELTESGYYIIQQNSSYSGAKASRAFSPIAKKHAKGLARLLTRAGYEAGNGYIYGTFTKNSDGSYTLDGFGTLTINKSGDSAVSLVITPTGRDAETVAATIDQSTSQTSALSLQICRTWYFDVNSRVEVSYTYEGKDYTYAGTYRQVESQWLAQAKKLGVDDYDEEDDDDDYYASADAYIEITFTRSGSYFALEHDSNEEEDYQNDFVVTTWRWLNESQNMIILDASCYDNDIASGDSAEAVDAHVRRVVVSGNNLIVSNESGFTDEDGLRTNYQRLYFTPKK